MLETSKVVNCTHLDKKYKCTKRNKRCMFVSPKHLPISLGLHCEDHTPNKIPTGFADEKFVWKSSMHLMHKILTTAIKKEQHALHDDLKHTEGRRARGHYPFIAREVATITEMVAYLQQYYQYQTSNIKMLDCGCGIGNIVLLFRAAGFDAHGVEYDEKTLEAGREFLSRFLMNENDPGSRLHQGDLLEYKHFGDYDIIYGYCPLSDSGLEKEFEDKMRWEAKDGALILGLGGREVHANKYGKGEVYFNKLMLNNLTNWTSANPWMKVGQKKLRGRKEKS